MSTRLASSPLYRRLLVSSVNELGYSNGASRWLRIAFMTASLTMAVSSVGLYLLARDPYSGNEIRSLITELYNAQRPVGGRLHQSQYSPPANTKAAHTDTEKATLPLWLLPDRDYT